MMLLKSQRYLEKHYEINSKSREHSYPIYIENHISEHTASYIKEVFQREENNDRSRMTAYIHCTESASCPL